MKIFHKIPVAIVFAFFLPIAALAQPSPPPGPWALNGASIYPIDNSMGITLPSNVTGGNCGAGCANFASLRVNGVPVPTTAGSVASFSAGATGLTPSTNSVGVVTLAGILNGTSGGTGVANTGKTITIGGNFAMSGGFTFTGTLTGNTAVTFPTSGTLATVAGTASSVSNSDGTLTISPTTGAVVASLALGHANTWTAQQINQGATTTSPGWYAQITGDTFPRVRVGLNATDIASIAFGPGNAARDTFIERFGVAMFRFGAPDAAAPVAQTLGVQNVVTGTSNTAGVSTTLQMSQGTGTGVGGSFIVQVAPAGSTGTSQNALATALTIDSTKTATFAGPMVAMTGAFGGASIGGNTIAAAGSVAFTSLTLGSIPYIGASGVISQNGPNLFWDATHVRLGVGTNTPSTKADFVTPGGAGAIASGVRFNSGGNATTGGIYMQGDSNGTTQYNFLIGNQFNINNGFEITPSTAGGGTTFSTPAFSIAGATGAITHGGATILSGTLTYGGITLANAMTGTSGGNLMSSIAPNWSTAFSAKTANFNVLSSNTGTTFSNTGASGEVDFTLPTASAGLWYVFVVKAAQTLKVIAGASTTISIGTTTSASAGNITANTAYSVVLLQAISSTEWIATSMLGSWTVN